MKILRFTPAKGGDPLFGILEDDLKTISVINGDPIFSGVAKNGELTTLDDVKLLAPVLPRSKVVCVGKNYSEHAKEMGGEVPPEPIIFLKPNTSVAGPNDVIHWPWMSERIDHESELAIVIGRICKDVPRDQKEACKAQYKLLTQKIKDCKGRCRDVTKEKVKSLDESYKIELQKYNDLKNQRTVLKRDIIKTRQDIQKIKREISKTTSTKEIKLLRKQIRDLRSSILKKTYYSNKLGVQIGTRSEEDLSQESAIKDC